MTILSHLEKTPSSVPITATQKDIWDLVKEEGEDANRSFNKSYCLRLIGPLDLEALRDAVRDLVNRHEALRMVFSRDGSTGQIMAPSDIEVQVSDWSTKNDGRDDEKLSILLEKEAARLFDLANGPLFRAQIIKQGKQNHFLIITIHKIICDRWSMFVLLKELGRIYSVKIKGQTPGLSIPQRFSEFALEQKRTDDTAEAQIDEQFWLKQFTQPVPYLDLPHYDARPKKRTYNAAAESRALDAVLLEQLKDLSTRNNCNLDVTLLAAFKTFLHRLTGQSILTLWTPAEGQLFTGRSDLVGHCVNMLALRTQINEGQTFNKYLEIVHKSKEEAFQHHQSPFRHLLRKLALSLDPGRVPLTPVCFHFDSNPARFEFQGLEVERIFCPIFFHLYELSLTAGEYDGKLVLTWTYNTNLFDAATMGYRMDEFEVLLHGIVTNPDGDIARLPLLPDKERQQVLIEWNDTDGEYPRDLCLHQLFETQVERTPDAVALVFEEHRLTYRELNQRANRLAHLLRQRGVGPEAVVAIFLDPCLEMVVGLLGVLKAGGAYLPLDPGYPSKRIAFIVKESKTPVILTLEYLAERVSGLDVPLIQLDTDVGELTGMNHENPENQTHPDQPAYVIYTSGSTGEPKGVVGHHRGMVNRFHWMWETYPFEPGEVFCYQTSLSFVSAIWRLLGPLLQGIKNVIAPIEALTDLPQLIRILSRHRVSRIVMVPSQLNVILNMPNASALSKKLPALKIWTVGGEVLTPSLVQRFKRILPGRVLLNLYGGTEHSADAAWYETTAIEGNQLHVPIGRPISNSKIYLLDRYMNPVPIGVIGEIHVGGISPALGYFNQPDLTAQYFVPDPFVKGSHARLHKSGDLGHWLPDGNLVFMGRADHQVKVSGNRVELGEIEAVLNKHPGLLETAVVLREDIRDDPRLVAYVVPSVEPQPTVNELRSFLGLSLPEYMLPSFFHTMEALPKTISGKINRLALPEPDWTRPELDTEFIAPRNTVEKRLAQLWCEILGLDRVSVMDNFFELGGQSLQLTRLALRINKTFKTELPIRQIFLAPTINEIGRMIFDRKGDTPVTEKGPQETSIPVIPRNETLPLSLSQTGLWFLMQMEPENPSYNLTYRLRLSGPLNESALEKSLNEIIRRHEILRTTFPSSGSSAIQVIAPGRRISLPPKDLRGFSETEREGFIRKLAEDEALGPFDLARGPLQRFTLLRLEDREYLLLFTMHHIVFDGWSCEIFMMELTALYAAFSRDEPSPLPDLPVQFADYAAWQHQWLRGPVLESLLSYWTRQLKDLPPVLELPFDRPRPSIQTYHGKSIYFDIGGPIHQRLNSLSRSSGTSLFMTLLASFAVLLFRYSGQEDLAIGAPNANRNPIETENLIGFFVNTMVLRADLSGSPTFRKLLERIRQTSLEAYSYQGLPFERLIEVLRPDRNLSYNPVFQVMFIFENAPSPNRKLEGVDFILQETTRLTSMFDLTLELKQLDDKLRGRFEFNTDLFDEETIIRMIGHFGALLDGIADRPGERITDLPIMPPEERQRILVEWNGAKRDYPDKCIHDLFTERAVQTPAKTALEFEGQKLTYDELNQKSNQLARYLLEIDLSPKTIIGLCIEPSLEMVIGLLGILKAGCAYLPIDPAYPPERISFMLEDSQTPVVLTRKRTVSRFKSSKARIISLDADENHLYRMNNKTPDTSTAPDHPAYVIYTSGSTGRPKGVVGLHRGAVNRFNWMWDAFPFERNEVCCVKTTLGFVDSVWEIFGPLLAGIKIIVFPSETVTDLPQFIQALAEKKVTRIVMVPSLLNEVLHMPDARSLSQRLPALRLWTASGETLPYNLYRRFREIMPNSRLLNLYGSSEVSADVTWFDTRAMTKELTNVPIGAPIHNSKIYLFDQYLKPVPIGVVGEIHVGGLGLAQGYLHQPALTDDKFISDPFSRDPGARLYKTGDLGRWLPDGLLEFVGRKDHQVKIRGYRLELGEVETALNKHPNVLENAVTLREASSGGPQLIAYIVPRKKPAPNSDELRRHLGNILPGYMLPSAFVALQAIPKTTSGKMNRLALPKPDPTGSQSGETYVAPRNDYEARLARLWENLLKIHPIGMDDNFFAIGGHSLLAVRLLGLVETEFGTHLPMKTFFQGPTITQYAAAMQNSDAKPAMRVLEPIQPLGRRPPFFFVCPDNQIPGMALAPHLGADQPFYGLTVSMLQDKLADERKIDVDLLVDLSIREIRTIQPEGPYYLGGYCLGGQFAHEIARRLLADGREVAILALVDTTWEIPNNYSSLRRQYLRVRTYGPSYLFKILLFPRLINLPLVGPFIKKRLGQYSQRLIDFLDEDWTPLPFLQALYQWFMNNPPKPYLGRIHLFINSEWCIQFKPDGGWQAARGLEIHEIRADHDTIFRLPHVKELAGKIRLSMDAVMK